MNKSSIDKAVLEFYRELPFNIYDDYKLATEKVIKQRATVVYPVLKKILTDHNIKSTIDVGCGTGWFINSLGYHEKNLNLTGLDFNKVATDYAENISKRLKNKTKFITASIFDYQPKSKFDLITSLGVLHHTSNCHEAIKLVCDYGNNNSILFLGLYHTYGRKPFLEFVKKYQDEDEQIRFEKYKELHNLSNSTHLYSWFRDQVLHPHETQHTFEEISPILLENGYEIISTSINKFDNYKTEVEIINMEKDLEEYGRNKIDNNIYYPGFFIVIAKKL
jgi:SAM-dependent methyltransferase